MRNPIEVARRTRIVPPHAARPLIATVFEGLSEARKQLPSVLLYDAEGARLFERVRSQPEYGIARAEDGLLREHAPALGRVVGPQAAVVEYGAGDGRHGELLLGALGSVHSYVPIDIEPTQLARARERFRRRGLALRIHPVCQDFRQYVALPGGIGGARRRLAYVPGATVGAFRTLEAVAFLNGIRESMGIGGGLLVGIDLLKDPAIHERAANDAAQAMAGFNRNLLRRLNRELDATFDLEAFVHRAVWDAEHARIEMSLLSTRTQCPSIAGIGVAVGAGEDILTSYAHRYTVEGFAALARIAGWTLREAWVETRHEYGLLYFEEEPITAPG